MVSKKNSNELLESYYHIVSSFDGNYYRGKWGYSHCSNPNPDLRIYFQSWVLPKLRNVILKLGITDDTKLIHELYEPYRLIELDNKYLIRGE